MLIVWVSFENCSTLIIGVVHNWFFIPEIMIYRAKIEICNSCYSRIFQNIFLKIELSHTK